MGVRKTTCAVVVAASALTMLDVQGAVGQLPDAPAVPDVPSLQPPVKVPQAPAPLPQVRVPVPKAPVEAPAVQAPSVAAPAPRAPVPEAPRVQVPGSSATKPSSGTASATTGSGSGASATRRQGSGSSPRGERPGRRARAHRARRTSAERDLRATVTRLWGCSNAVSTVQRRVLQRRAGLDGRSPTSVEGTARALDLSPRAVRRAQRSGLRRLRQANRSDGCAMGAATGGLAGETQALVAVATAPALRPVADFGGMSDDDRQAASRGEGGVLGRRSSSTSGEKDDEGGRGPTKAQVGAPGDEGFSPFPLLALLLALGGGALLMLLRRDRYTPVAVEHPVVPPAPVSDEPQPEPIREDPRPEPVEPHVPSIPAPPWRSVEERPAPDPPWRTVDERPAQAEPRLPQESPSVAHDARRAAEVAASGLASAAIGVLMRARRRR